MGVSSLFPPNSTQKSYKGSEFPFLVSYLFSKCFNYNISFYVFVNL